MSENTRRAQPQYKSHHWAVILDGAILKDFRSVDAKKKRFQTAERSHLFRGGEESGQFCTLEPWAGPLQSSEQPLPLTPSLPLNIYWTSQVTEWVWLHLGEKLQLIFKQQLPASKLITDLQSVSCKLKSQMECWQRCYKRHEKGSECWITQELFKIYFPLH